MVKVTVKCPCGRRVSHQVMQEGQRPAALLCDAACIQAGRQQQLAGAFGVEDPSHHVSSFDRNRSAHLHPHPVECRQECPAAFARCRIQKLQYNIQPSPSLHPVHHMTTNVYYKLPGIGLSSYLGLLRAAASMSATWEWCWTSGMCGSVQLAHS